ncbi:hypothetical protein D3C86_1639940 [compost metagenome]
MPPRALIEPEMGSSLSAFSHSEPLSARPASSSSRRCSCIRGTIPDSMIPPAAAVSGKTLAMYGAKRCSRALASATSAAPRPTSARAVATGAMPGLNQAVSRSATSSRINGWLAHQASCVLP